ncbi:MAG: uracil-DNA glycosylase [Rhodobacteraceae bacterium]|jgi:uracil-DNA glycosylase family 4|nr:MULTISPECIES: uracil-DNA glycosylase [Salipiger]MAB08272.1 uracil-DNA glycosylase [Paracoccaceae bacterium]GGA07542.1 uracil-DNA glycosylase [Salipiger profundus]SFC45068.1 DNA polymerase [Salipiger profundus]
MDSGFTEMDWHWARAALDWQLEMGADETMGELPVDRFAAEAEAQAARAAARATPAAAAGGRAPMPGPVPLDTGPDPVEVAQQAAAQATTLDALREAMAAFEHCELKRGARNLVFCDGTADARVMIVGEAPGRDEDRQGKPFVGRAGQLLDRMLAPVGLSRDRNVYITNVLPWRPPQNRDPKPDEIAMMKPFLAKHIALVDPELLVIMGNISCDALLGRRGITRLRGKWAEAEGRPALPMFHPAYLLRQPQMKREAWADVLELAAKLKAGG